MKSFVKLIFVLFVAVMPMGVLLAQTAKTAAPGSCKIYLDGKVLTEVTVANAIAWSEQTPPMVQCEDGKIYKLETFTITYMTLKPFLSKEFGIGQAGFPIRAVQEIKNGKAGDTIILKDVTYLDIAGTKSSLPVISVKMQ